MNKNNSNEILWGDIYYCDLGNMKGSVQCGKRPVIVIQNNCLNRKSPTVMVAVITSVKKKKLMPSHILIGKECGLQEESMIMLEQTRTVDKKEELLDYIGAVIAIRIAQSYKSELEKVVISDEDIQHLHNTVSNILEIIKSIQITNALPKGEYEIAKVKSQVESYEKIKELISVDTLKTMQLLGFNYKAAIGEPLTEICANAISKLGNKTTVSKRK